MERKDRILPPPPLPSAAGLIREPEATQHHSLRIAFKEHLLAILVSLAGKGGSYSADPGEIMLDASRFAIEARQVGFDGLADRFENVSRVCGKRWLRTNGSGNGKSTDNPS